MTLSNVRFVLVGATLSYPMAGFPQSGPSSVERGRYLVNQLGKCGDCHTARIKGNPDTKRWLKGSVLDVQPLHPVPEWATAAPDLTATSPLWKLWGEKAMVEFFVTGRGPSGRPAAAPMPVYTITEQDARAIVAYLKSLR